MSQRPNSARRNLLITLVVIVLVIILLLLARCLPVRRATTSTPTSTAPPPAAPQAAPPAAPAAAQPDEVISPATLKVPEQVPAGSAFAVEWTGPGNAGDYITIAAPDAPATAGGNYQQTKADKPVDLTAPMETGRYEVRYITARSRKILARSTFEVTPAAAALDAAAEVTLGAPFPVTWTGPKNAGDYITIVPKDAPDAQYGNYTDVAKGSPLTVTAPTLTGEAELRYVSGQGKKVLARRPIKIIGADVTISAPAEAVAGSRIDVTWTGPNNSGDYITVVEKSKPDGQYGNYTNTSKTQPLKLLLPIMEGEAELRYMTGQGGRVLARRSITILAAKVTLSAPDRCGVGASVAVTWTGPNNSGDYITIVEKSKPDNQFGAYTNTSVGSPLRVTAPKQACEAEVRYVTGQGGKVLARVPIKVEP